MLIKQKKNPNNCSEYDWIQQSSYVSTYIISDYKTSVFGGTWRYECKNIVFNGTSAYVQKTLLLLLLLMWNKPIGMAELTFSSLLYAQREDSWLADDLKSADLW